MTLPQAARARSAEAKVRFAPAPDTLCPGSLSNEQSPRRAVWAHLRAVLVPRSLRAASPLKAALAILVLLLFPAFLRAQAPCESCHDQAAKLAKGAHSALSCDSCHQDHEKFPHPANIPKPKCDTCHSTETADVGAGVHGEALGEAACSSCHGDVHELIQARGAAFRNALPDTCGTCHADAAQQYKGSVHGQALAQGLREAPVCIDCHNAHKILKHTQADSPVSNGHIRDTCGNCHGNVRLAQKFGMPSDRLVSFDNSFHGLAAKEGSQTVANCASCHGVHNILPSSDPNSTINPKNLAKTCGQCHPGAGTRFAIGEVHLLQGKAQAPAVRWVRLAYAVLIPFTLALMFLHNGGDWLRKMIRARFSGFRPSGPVKMKADLRMMPFERVQHAMLASSFLTLAWSGFALKYPDQWWAQPLLFSSAQAVRGLTHRIAAVIFLVVCALHVASLIFSPRLRERWKTMWPKWSDLPDAMAQFAYNVGLLRNKPKLVSHAYPEKVEYLALVWGAMVMAVTGLPLWANNLFLRLVPKVWLDVATAIHFYEAVLATAAIVVWHFYFVIFDPNVYPINPAFLTGYLMKPDTEEEPAQGD